MTENRIKTVRIIILGAGFAGLKAAQKITKYLAKDGTIGAKNVTITLIDKSDIHLYTPDLYEIANSFNQQITDECLTKLKDCVATRIQTLINKKSVTFRQGEIIKIDPKNQFVELKKGAKLEYDYLLCALGSQQNFYNIPGLKQFSYPVKTIKDGLVINCHLDTFFHFLWKKKTKKEVKISIGGGGATGVEFSAEMVRYVDKLCEKYDYPRNKVTIQILQAGNELVGQGKKVSDYTKKRLEEKGIRILFNHMITKAEPDKIYTKSPTGKAEIIESDVLIWTGGVMVNQLVKKYLGDEEHKGFIKVNRFMQSEQYPTVYAAGDNAFFKDPKTKKIAPMLAQNAWEEGEVAAYNIVSQICGKKQTTYKVRNLPLIMPIGGKWGIVKIGPFVYRGFLGWIVRRLTDLWYAAKIMPFWKALKKWHHDNQVFVKND